jgi:hypothetical protein
MQWMLKGCLAVILITWVSGCSKEITDPDTDQSSQGPSGTSGQVDNGPRLSYGDSVFFLRAQPGDYTMLPVSKKTPASYFKAIPLGLSLDSATGRVNISRSETGIRYKIYQITTSGEVLDSVKIVVSGIDYQDAIYDIAATPNRYDTAFPIYNARPELTLPCGNVDLDDDNDLDDDDNGCVFDETDLDDDGNDDIAGVIQDKLLVDIKKGTIDVEASFNAGIFGSSDPANGLSRDFTFYYRLQDASNRSLNKITVRVMHFRKRSDIPQDLLATLNLRKNLTNAINSRAVGVGRITTAQDAMQFVSDRSDIRDFSTKPKRPPIIIIVSQ